MNNPLDQVFKPERLQVMAHAVAGYPDFVTSVDYILTLAESGVDLLEIQIPFSDPIADGPTITRANQVALEKGATPDLCFGYIKEIVKQVERPVLVMTYINLPQRKGFGPFLKLCHQAGVSGLIIPDLPYDVELADEYYHRAREFNIYPVHVVSPGMSNQRLQGVVKKSRGFIYSTLKVGITGARKTTEEPGLAFVKRIRKYTSLPVMCGFGISTLGQIRGLKGISDGVIIGSHLINLFNQGGIEGVRTFLSNLPGYC